MYLPALLLGSDYSGSSVHEANKRVFLSTYGELDGVWSVYGDYGTYGVAIRLDSLTPEMVAEFRSLESYCVLSDYVLSEVELEREYETWENCYRSDFRHALYPLIGEDAADELSDDVLWELFTKLMDWSNTYWQHEEGNSVYVDMEQVIAAYEDGDVDAAREAVPATDTTSESAE